MKNLLNNLRCYLDQTLGVDMKAKKWDSSNLPFYLNNRFEFFEAQIGGSKTLLMINREVDELTPKAIAQNTFKVSEKTSIQTIYIAEHMKSYNRNRLLKKQVPFIVPNNQLYLPFLCIDLRENFRTPATKRKFLSPAAQVCIINAMYQEFPSILNTSSEPNNHSTNEPDRTEFPTSPKDLANNLNYSYPTIIRAMKEIKALKIDSTNTLFEPKEQQATKNKITPRQILNDINPFLKNPLRKVVFIKTEKEFGLPAGITALAQQSLLADSEFSTIAISQQEWLRLRIEDNLEPFEYAEPGCYQVEIWDYDPRVLSKRNVVDPISLYLSLKNDENERIQTALEQILARLSQ